MSVDIIKDIVTIKVDFNGKEVKVPVVWYEDTSLYEPSIGPRKYRRSLFATLGFIFNYKDLLEEGGVNKKLESLYEEDAKDNYSYHSGIYFDSLGKAMTWNAWKNRWLRAFDYAVTPEDFVKAMPLLENKYNDYVTSVRSTILRYLSGETLSLRDMEVFNLVGRGTIRGIISRKKPSSIIRKKLFDKGRKPNSSPREYRVELLLPYQSSWYGVVSLGKNIRYTSCRDFGRWYTKHGALRAAARIVRKYAVKAARVVDKDGKVFVVKTWPCAY